MERAYPSKDFDHFTKFVWVQPIWKATAGEVESFLENNTFHQFRVLRLKHSDNCKQFVSQVFAKLLSQNPTQKNRILCSTSECS